MAWAFLQTDQNNSSTTLALTLPSGTGRKAFFILAWEFSGLSTISTIDFGGSTPVLISDGTNDANVPDTNNNTAVGYYFDIPDAWSGSKTLTLTWANSVVKNVNIVNIYSGLATGNADVVQTYQSAGTSITSNTLNITPSASVGLIVSGAGTSSNTSWSPGTGETERGDGKSGGSAGCGTEKGHTSSAANSTTQTSAIAGRYQQWNSAWSEAAAGTTAALTGTATSSIVEADIVNGGKTVVLTLTGDTWVAAGTGAIGSTADTQALIDGMTSAQSETLGWNNEVRDKEVVSAVVRTSNTVATITLTAASAYDITAQETITVTIPAAALVTSTSAVVASPTFTVDFTATGIEILRRRIEDR